MTTTTRRKALLTPTEALIPREMFDRLPEYSCSLPTGTRIGKCWKRRVPYGATDDEAGWLLGCYERKLPPDSRHRRGSVLIRWRAVTVVE